MPGNFHRFISKSWRVFPNPKSTIQSPRFYQQLTTFKPPEYHQKRPFFAKPPFKNTTPEKFLCHSKSLTQLREHGTLIKFGAAAHVSTSQGLRERQVCPIDLHAPHAAQSMEESGQRSTAPRLRF
jgi:hypothetical protein